MSIYTCSNVANSSILFRSCCTFGTFVMPNITPLSSFLRRSRIGLAMPLPFPRTTFLNRGLWTPASSHYPFAIHKNKRFLWIWDYVYLCVKGELKWKLSLLHLQDLLKVIKNVFYSFSISHFVLELFRFVWYVNET